MASKHIVGIRIATEGSYGSVGANGYPDGTGLGAWTGMEIADRAQIVPVGDPLQDERMGARDGWWGRPAEPVKPGAALQPIRRAQITIDQYVRPRGVGTTWATYAASPIGKILGSRLRLLDVPAASSFAAAGVNERLINGVHPDSFATGQALRVTRGGAAQYVGTTRVEQAGGFAADIFFAPGLGAVPGAAETYFPLACFFQPRPDDSTNLPSFALELSGMGWEATCYACTLSALTLTMEEATRAWRLSYTIDSDWVDYTTAAALPPVEQVTDGQIVHGLAAPLVMSSPWTDATVPNYLSATLNRDLTLCVDAFTLSMSWTMATKGCGNTWLGRTKPEAVDMEATLEIVVPEYLPALATDYSLRRYRNLMLGGSCYNAAGGEGACLHIPAAYLTEEPIKPDVGADYLRTRLVYAPGRWPSDNPDTGVSPPQLYDTTCANTPIRLSLG